MVINSKFYKEKKVKDFYYSLAFLTLSILLTLGLFLYNVSIEKENSELKAKITTTEADVSGIKQNKEILIFELISNPSNKAILEQISFRSQIPKFMNHLYKAAEKTNLDFRGFNYSWWAVSLDIVARWDEEESRYNDKKYPKKPWSYKEKKADYIKIIDFLKRYEEDYPEAMFTIDKIRRFVWWDEINFSVVFTLK